ncbi:hypothetical protein OH77DRAFT_1430417 [Trametes cingulata]|nr:hypothetical protein OH77DRAFT_1430417 [Trametes cingulata]
MHAISIDATDLERQVVIGSIRCFAVGTIPPNGVEVLEIAADEEQGIISENADNEACS